MTRDYAEYLQDILAEAQLAQQFLNGVTFQEFFENPEKQRAVTRSLEIIGEAARGIPDKVRKQYPDVEWRKMSGMRDRLIHGYAQISLRRVWDTVKEDLPVLEQQIIRILGEIDEAAN